MIRIGFPGFSGTPAELSERLRRGEISPREVPLLAVLDQAIAQVEGWPLERRAAVAAELAALLLLRLGLADGEEPPEEEAERAVALLVEMERAVAELSRRARRRRKVVPVPPAPLPGEAALARMRPESLLRFLAERPRLDPRPLVAFGLREAWRRVRAVLLGLGRAGFSRLAPRRFALRAVHLAALLEAARRGWVELFQEEPYGEIEVLLIEPGGELDGDPG